MTAESRRPQPAITPPPDDKERLDKLLDEALEQTFPASDPPAILQPAPNAPAECEGDK